MTFKYKGFDQNGKNITNTMDANSIEDVKIYLSNQNIVYSSIKESKNYFKLDFLQPEFTKKELSTLSRDISFYIKSGISISGALKLAIGQYQDNKRINDFLVVISNAVEEGSSFSDALEDQKVIKLPNFYIQSIKASQDGGILDSVLMELSVFVSSQDKIEKKVSNAMAYPMFIIVTALLMVGFMLSSVVPKVVGIFQSNKQELPLITQYVLGASDFVSDYYLFIIISVASIVFFVKIMNSKSTSFKYKYDKYVLKIPLVGNIILISELSRFSYMSSLLMKSGMTLVETLQLSAKLLDNTVVSDIFDQTSSLVVEGERLSNSLMRVGKETLPRSFIQTIALGEETSMLQTVLSTQAIKYNEENDDKITFMLSLLEPVMMLFVGSMIAVIVLGMMLPIFSINLGGV